MAGSAILRTSNASVLASNLSTDTNRQIVKQGHGALTGANKDFSDVTLIAGQDAAYSGASLGTPIVLGLDMILLKPTQYPEVVKY